jgi:hypothetical protein
MPAPPRLGGEQLLSEDYATPGGCPVAAVLDAPLPRAGDTDAILGSDGSTTVGAVVRRRLSTAGGTEDAEGQAGVPTGTRHTVRLPFPPFVGDRHTNARFTEGGAVLRLLLEAEAAGRGNGLMDAQPEWYNVLLALSRPPRRQLSGADVACALRIRAVLLCWGAHDGAATPCPLAEATRDRLRRCTQRSEP